MLLLPLMLEVMNNVQLVRYLLSCITNMHVTFLLKITLVDVFTINETTYEMETLLAFNENFCVVMKIFIGPYNHAAANPILCPFCSRMSNL